MKIAITGTCPSCEYRFRAWAIYLEFIEQPDGEDEVRVRFTCDRCGEFTSMSVPPFLALEMIGWGVPTEAMYEAVLALMSEDVST